MSLKSVAAVIDDKLHEVFHRRQPDVKNVRRKAISTIETARRQFASTGPTRGRKVWALSNEVVRFTPGYRITERETMYVPVARFNEMLDNLEAAIKAGELDDALLADKAAAPGAVEAAVAADKPRRARSPESTAKAIATRAANKAARLGEAVVAKATKGRRAKA